MTWTSHWLKHKQSGVWSCMYGWVAGSQHREPAMKLAVTTILEGHGICHGNMPYYTSTMEDASCNLGMEIDKLTQREAPQAWK